MKYRDVDHNTANEIAIKFLDRLCKRQPRFTKEEMADAKVLMRALGATGLKRNRYEDIYATSDTSADTLLDSEMFPSLRPGQTVSLEEIVT